jgi:prepilin-type N-terminal cleavage/methylation domain-containing protein
MTRAHKTTLKKRGGGFTLIETTIVLMIVGILLGGILVPLSAQMDQQNVTNTKKALSEIKDALIGFALANGQLPCPADPTIATGSASAGISRATCTTAANSTGVIPWATLGVNETDAWGNRYTYRVTSDFTDALGVTFGKDQNGNNCIPSPTPTLATFGLCSVGTLNVLSAAAGVTVAANVPAVIISHGKSSAGAWTTKGTQLAAGSNTDEQANSDGSANLNYVSHTFTPTFDDLVVWISPSILYNRMVTAGKLP